MKELLLYIWQLPQNLLGLAVKTVTKAEKGFAGHYYWHLHSGLSLGKYRFIHEHALAELAKHEEGHQKQSMILGWLYLLVIGIPSITWAGLKRLGAFPKVSYYAFYTEKWVDKLAGIKRQED